MDDDYEDGYGRKDRLVDLLKMVAWVSLDCIAVAWSGHATHWGKSFWDALKGN